MEFISMWKLYILESTSTQIRQGTTFGVKMKGEESLTGGVS